MQEMLKNASYCSIWLAGSGWLLGNGLLLLAMRRRTSSTPGFRAGACQGAAGTVTGQGQRTDLFAGKEDEAPVMGLRLLYIFTCHPHTQGRAGFLQTHGAIPTKERLLGACTMDTARTLGWWPVLQLSSTFQPPLRAISVQASKGKTLYHLLVFRL